MNVAYVVWLEHLNCPIMKSQVLDVCAKCSIRGINLHFVYFSKRSNLKESQEILHATLPPDVKKIVIPVILPNFAFRFFSWFFYSAWQLPIIYLASFFSIKKLMAIYKFDILHFRSYPIAFNGLLLKRWNESLSIIFDPRSPFPEECITLGNFSSKSLSYKFWKWMEAKYVGGFDAVVATTFEFSRALSENAERSNLVVIPNNVDIDRFSVTEQSSSAIRRRLGFSDDQFIFCYLGSLGESLWNDPHVYANFIKSLRNLNIPHSFLFITPSLKILEKVFHEHNILSSEYVAVASSFADVPSYLTCADVGLNLMFKRDARLSVKTVEYFASGLSVIANIKAEGVAKLIETQNLGVVIDELRIDDAALESIRQIHCKLAEYRARALEYATTMCSTSAVSDKYISLYNDLREEKVQQNIN
jgi:glycosyltransferase involved in cell wall biosynthesis